MLIDILKAFAAGVSQAVQTSWKSQRIPIGPSWKFNANPKSCAQLIDFPIEVSSSIRAGSMACEGFTDVG